MEEIDRTTLKAISADTRLRILKMLSEHRATCADISKRLGLSPSTVNEHLKKLEASGLVIRIETGHKWVYYEPSRKGGALMVGPVASPQFVLVLAIGILMFLGGAFFAIAQKLPVSGGQQLGAEAAGAPIMQKSVGAIADAATQYPAAQPSVLPILAMLAGAVIIVVLLSAYYKKK